MSTTVTIILAVLSSGAFTAIVNAIINAINRAKESKSGYNQGVRLIIKVILKAQCERYIEQGWIYFDEYEDILALHSVYHDKLGGNGYLDSLMADVKKLPKRGIN